MEHGVQVYLNFTDYFKMQLYLLLRHLSTEVMSEVIA